MTSLLNFATAHELKKNVYQINITSFYKIDATLPKKVLTPGQYKAWNG